MVGMLVSAICIVVGFMGAAGAALFCFLNAELYAVICGGTAVLFCGGGLAFLLLREAVLSERKNKKIQKKH